MAYVPQEVVEWAWKEAPEGVWKTRGSWRVLKDEKMVVVRPARVPKARGTTGIWSRVVVFPRPEHKDKFIEAAKGVRAKGPAMYNPGAIGTLELVRDTERSDRIVMRYAQAHYMIEGNPRLKDPRTGLPRPGLPVHLAGEYEDWRRQGFRAAIETARRNGKRIVVIHSCLTGGGRRARDKPSQFEKEVREICRELGVSVRKRSKTHGKPCSEAGYDLHINPTKRVRKKRRK